MLGTALVIGAAARAPAAGRRPGAVAAGDARDRPDVVLLVPVALAGAAAGAAALGHPLGTRRPGSSRRRCPSVLAVLTLRAGREPVPIRRGPASRSAERSLAWRRRRPPSPCAWAWCCWRSGRFRSVTAPPPRRWPSIAPGPSASRRARPRRADDGPRCRPRSRRRPSAARRFRRTCHPTLAEAPGDKPTVFLNGCVRSWREVGQAECASGDTASATTVALVGDSHAAMWNPALEPVAEQRHWRLETLGKVTCPLMDLPITSPYLGREYTECEQWRGEIMGRLQSEQPRADRAEHVASVRRRLRVHLLRPGVGGRTEPVGRTGCGHRGGGSGARARSPTRAPRCRHVCPATSTMRSPARRRGPTR